MWIIIDVFRTKNSKEEERERDGVKVIFLRRKRRILSNELYYMWIIIDVSYEKFERGKERKRES